VTLNRIVFGANPRRTAVRIIGLIAVAVATFTWVLIPIRAEGISMLPTYESGSFKFVNKLAYKFSEPRRRDVVAIRLAGPNVLYVKRVVGLPGERVAIREGFVFINDVPLPEPYVHHRDAWDVAEVTVGPHEYFVIGDNRGMAARDHDFGRADASRIVGKVIF
jgi:signal peptidase I